MAFDCRQDLKEGKTIAGKSGDEVGIDERYVWDGERGNDACRGRIRTRTVYVRFLIPSAERGRGHRSAMSLP